MPTLKVAHLRQQGVDLIIAPLDHNFGNKTRQDQQEIVAEIQVHSRQAGLAGTVVPVWGTAAGDGWLSSRRTTGIRSSGA